MRLRTVGQGLAIGVALAWGPAPASAQLPPPPPPPATLWSFLGVPQGYRAFRDNAFNRNGNRPGLERKPPLRAIADPRNLDSPDPAIKKAAEVKQAEDLAPQKIKAIKYLAKIGCGCYNRDGSITDALIKAMDDCTEDVRYAAVTAISEAAASEMCANCKQRSCCSEEIGKKLYEIAYERDDMGCYLEPSERVRTAAMEALRVCCPGGGEEMFFEMGPPPTTEVPLGPEQPSILQPGGPEQPAPGTPPGVPPAAPPPGVIPLQNPPPPAPPAAFAPPAGPSPTASQPYQPAPAAEAPAARPQRSSRRTAQLQELDASPRIGAGVNQSATAAPPTTERPAGGFDPIQESIAHSIHVLSTASDPVPIDGAAAAESLDTASSEALDTATVAGSATAAAEPPLPPVVSPASLHRLPPVAGLPSEFQPPVVQTEDRVPPPPLPPTASPTTRGSSAQARLAFLRRVTTPAGDTQQRPGTQAQPASHSRPAAPPAAQPAAGSRSGVQRAIPGMRYGSGAVVGIHSKQNVAMIEFASEQAVPVGSLVRVYHEYAFVGRKPVCDLQVIRGENGMAAAVARPGSNLADLSIGDQAIVLE